MRPWDRVIGQDRAVAQLRAAASSPVHAYLLEGPPGSGKRTAAIAFAAALLCQAGGCGDCEVCDLVYAERHPDVRIVEPEGSFLMTHQAGEIIAAAALSPAEGHRNVLILVDFHRVHPQAAPKLLKIVEEPPERTVFVILAEQVPAELLTIASRCVRIEFAPLDPATITSALVDDGVAEATARQVAESAGGRLDRARLLVSDPGFAARRDQWRAIPHRLDGSGAAVADAVRDLVASLDEAAAALEARQAEERIALDERIERTGERGGGKKELVDRHKREVRRLRTDELRSGLAMLVDAYRDAASGSGAAAFVAASDVVQRANEVLVRNPTESLLLESVLLRLPPLELRPDK